MTDSRAAQNAIKRILKSGLLISAAGANIAHMQSSELSRKGSPLEENFCHVSCQTAISLPGHVTVLLDNIREPCMLLYINLEIAAQALVCGYNRGKNRM